MNSRRYTESQILYGLREAWSEATCIYTPFDANTNIDTFMTAEAGWDELDLEDIFRTLELFFGLNCSNKEWAEFFQLDVAKRSLAEWKQTVAPKLTFGSLSRFIADRAPVIATFDTISVLGRPCLPAGVFLGIQRVAHEKLGHRRQFPPSARIIDMARGGDLGRFWKHLRWMTEHAIPELPTSWREITTVAGCLGTLAVIAAFILTPKPLDDVWVKATLLGAGAFYLLAAGYKHFTNPLPRNLVTFRDLSLLIATHRAREDEDASSKR